MPTEIKKQKLEKQSSPLEIIYHYYDIIKPKPKRKHVLKRRVKSNVWNA